MEQKIDNKHIKKYILKAILYIIFLWIAYDFFLLIPDILVILLYSILPDDLALNGNIENISSVLLIYLPIIFSPILCYIIAKLFGIFNYIDKLRNLITKFLALIIISSLSSVILFIVKKHKVWLLCMVSLIILIIFLRF